MISQHRRGRHLVRWTLDLQAMERARILANLTYADLGQKANVHRTSLAEILQGRRQPTMGTAHAIVTALELEPTAVFHFDVNSELADEN